MFQSSLANIVLNKFVFNDLAESNFLVIRGTLSQSLAADTAKERLFQSHAYNKGR